MRVLVLIMGAGGPQWAGPDIRGWQIASGLADSHSVTAVVRRTPTVPTPAAVRVVPWRRRRILLEALRHDAVVGPWIQPWLLMALASRRTLAVPDLYDPIELELTTWDGSAAREHRLGRERLSRRAQLAFANLLLCASQSQSEHLSRDLAEVVPDVERRARVLTVPFAVDPDSPPRATGALRARFPAIGEDDPVLLWWGSVWRWFDPVTAIHAFERVLERRPDARLVFCAGTPPGPELRELGDARAVRELAISRGLLDRSVFLVEDWIPYARRHEYLGDADVGISLHRDAAEAAVAARARYTDYLWARLPCVLSEGNELADRLAAGGFAATVPVGDAEAAAAALVRLLDDRASSAARAAAEPLVAELAPERVMAPLLEALEDPVPLVGRGVSAAAALAAARYYAFRLRARSPWS